MTEIIYPRDGDAVTLRPCPPWCTLTEHFDPDLVVDVDDGFHHYGPEITVRTSDRMFIDSPDSVVKVFVTAWTHPLGAEPGPGRVELQLENADTSVELTPDQARAVSAALLHLADSAARTTPDPDSDRSG